MVSFSRVCTRVTSLVVGLKLVGTTGCIKITKCLKADIFVWYRHLVINKIVITDWVRVCLPGL